MDIAGIYFNRGPESRLLTAPYAGIGFLEAHGLAFLSGKFFRRRIPWLQDTSSLHWNLFCCS